MPVPRPIPQVWSYATIGECPDVPFLQALVGHALRTLPEFSPQVGPTRVGGRLGQDGRPTGALSAAKHDLSGFILSAALHGWQGCTGSAAHLHPVPLPPAEPEQHGMGAGDAARVRRRAHATQGEEGSGGGWRLGRLSDPLAGFVWSRRGKHG